MTELKDLWIPGGLFLGFQVTLFKWRLEEKAGVGDRGDVPWLVPSDYVNLAGILVILFGVYLLPLSRQVNLRFATVALGLGALLFVGHVVGLAAHYQALFNSKRKREFALFPAGEKWVVAGTCVTCIAYVVLAVLSS